METCLSRASLGQSCSWQLANNGGSSPAPLPPAQPSSCRPASGSTHLPASPAPRHGRRPHPVIVNRLSSSPAPHPAPSLPTFALGHLYSPSVGLGSAPDLLRLALPLAHGFRPPPAPCLAAWAGLRTKVLHPRFFPCFSTTKHSFNSIK